MVTTAIPEQVREAGLVRNVVKLLHRRLGDDADNPTHIFTEPSSATDWERPKSLMR